MPCVVNDVGFWATYLCGGIAITDAEVLSRRSVGSGEARVERNDQFQFVAENDGEVWFYIQFMVLRIKAVWEYGDVEQWVKFWSEDGADHELLDRWDRIGVPAHRRHLLKYSSPTATVKTAIDALR